MADLADTIRNIPLFSGLSREDVAKIMGNLVEVEFAAGKTAASLLRGFKPAALADGPPVLSGPRRFQFPRRGILQ